MWWTSGVWCAEKQVYHHVFSLCVCGSKLSLRWPTDWLMPLVLHKFTFSTPKTERKRREESFNLLVLVIRSEDNVWLKRETCIILIAYLGESFSHMIQLSQTVTLQFLRITCFISNRKFLTDLGSLLESETFYCIITVPFIVTWTWLSSRKLETLETWDLVQTTLTI